MIGGEKISAEYSTGRKTVARARRGGGSAAVTGEYRKFGRAPGTVDGSVIARFHDQHTAARALAGRSGHATNRREPLRIGRLLQPARRRTPEGFAGRPDPLGRAARAVAGRGALRWRVGDVFHVRSPATSRPVL